MSWSSFIYTLYVQVYIECIDNHPGSNPGPFAHHRSPIKRTWDSVYSCVFMYIPTCVSKDDCILSFHPSYLPFLLRRPQWLSEYPVRLTGSNVSLFNQSPKCIKQRGLSFVNEGCVLIQRERNHLERKWSLISREVVARQGGDLHLYVRFVLRVVK